MAKVSGIQSHEGCIVDGETHERRLHEYPSLLARHDQIHHLPCGSKELFRAVVPEAVWDRELFSWKGRVIQGADRLAASKRQEGKICSVEHNDREKVDDMHHDIRRRLLVNDMGIGVPLGILKIPG
jgi:hypothetical protein